ncbi:HIV Tat-specific factor 1 homolog [Trichogramma pretiosum]|uniref:HIV Tat-specific factor 1 homolog n=1 Tax=Trichogramma pretiosum TaxID=7493 RepID=UPI0006C99CD7|nr:HIV Tat-specific factor 1 homolog [Trichogramma pretiosum]
MGDPSDDSVQESLNSENVTVKNDEVAEHSVENDVNNEIDSKTESSTEEKAEKVVEVNAQPTTSIQNVVPQVKPVWREKPKVYKRNDDDIEEFDTDEEDESKEDPQSSDPSNSANLNYSSHMTYEGDKCIYTEPGTGKRFIWDSQENKWCAEGDDENPQSLGVYGFENDTHTYTDPKDGTVYIWDKEKNGWFPKIDDDFMARYQMNYGFADSNDDANKPNSTNLEQKPQISKEEIKKSKEEKKAENKRKAQEPPQWFEIDEAHNTTIYISNLPLDITLDELEGRVTTYGILARDDKGKNKLKLYTDENGEIKGDARCTYLKVESVNLALNYFDGSDIRGNTISVQRAKFQMKGDYDPTRKPKKKKKDKERQKKIKEKLLDWRPDRLPGEPSRNERIVIIKNLFSPEEFDKDAGLVLEFSQDIRSECTKCGEVKKVIIYDRNPEGVAQVTFKEVEEAQACVQLLNNRWFAQRRITAEIWDGKTKYKIKETEAQIEERINKWDKFLEEQEDAEDAKKTAAT